MTDWVQQWENRLDSGRVPHWVLCWELLLAHSWDWSWDCCWEQDWGIQLDCCLGTRWVPGCWLDWNLASHWAPDWL